MKSTFLTASKPSLGADEERWPSWIDAYEEETLTDANGKRGYQVVLKFHPALAPFKAAVLPLAKKLGPVAEPVYEELSKYFNVITMRQVRSERP